MTVLLTCCDDLSRASTQTVHCGTNEPSRAAVGAILLILRGVRRILGWMSRENSHCEEKTGTGVAERQSWLQIIFPGIAQCPLRPPPALPKAQSQGVSIAPVGLSLPVLGRHAPHRFQVRAASTPGAAALAKIHYPDHRSVSQTSDIPVWQVPLSSKKEQMKSGNEQLRTRTEQLCVVCKAVPSCFGRMRIARGLWGEVHRTTDSRV